VIVYDFHIVAIALFPHKTDTVAINDSDAMLALSIALERLQHVAWGDLQLTKRSDVVEHPELSAGMDLYFDSDALDLSATPDGLGFLRCEGPYHDTIVSLNGTIVK
jgi:hypothetical protein